MTFVPELPLVTPDQKTNIVEAPRTAKSHRALLRSLPGMNAVQVGGSAPKASLEKEISAIAWNVERGLFPLESAALMAGFKPDVVLLSEVDHGMARTGQQHTTEIMAKALHMQYAFGVEFHELDLGGPTERAFCTDNFNARGWHGNAVLSSVPFIAVKLIRLDDHGHWFSSDELDADPDQPRVGGRMAIAAILPWNEGTICVVSTHLESNADADHRAVQFDHLLDEIDGFAPDMPVLIGGDLNTGNHQPPDFDWRCETLFEKAQARGYAWDATPPGMTTRPSLITPHPDRQMKLDWFCSRGLKCRDTALIPAIDDTGKPVSDHEAIWGSVF
ncbi:endonuclease/exonuclease/phosphatase family protein [Halocynthiibacter namhaensis]|uniref:endonuclease/exonuclease/phosphatase family protein n=1 Tax=Halocynthiibacter namhaensis TaxID=1290553 RepID=UPI0005790E54|nr:endonuclease/exonuclease/phosphatase family protein [Halocynthiibacter namhaensis]